LESEVNGWPPEIDWLLPNHRTKPSREKVPFRRKNGRMLNARQYFEKHCASRRRKFYSSPQSLIILKNSYTRFDRERAGLPNDFAT
jgi:hypothetical protein